MLWIGFSVASERIEPATLVAMLWIGFSVASEGIEPATLVAMLSRELAPGTCTDEVSSVGWNSPMEESSDTMLLITPGTAVATEVACGGSCEK